MGPLLVLTVKDRLLAMPVDAAKATIRPSRIFIVSL